MAVIALPRGDAEHADPHIRIEHRADGVHRRPEPVFRRTTLPLEVERGERSLRADPFEHALRDVCVVVEHLLPAGAATDTEPRELARRARAKAPCCTPRRSRGVRTARRTKRGHSLRPVRAARDHGCGPRRRPGRAGSNPAYAEPRARLRAARERPRRREQLPRDEKTTRVLLGDVHVGTLAGSRRGCSLDHAERRPRDPAARLRRLPDPADGDGRGGRATRSTPATGTSTRREMYDNEARRRRGGRARRPRPRRRLHHEQAQQRRPRARRRAARVRETLESSASTTSTCS